jgi:hypothetical protein
MNDLQIKTLAGTTAQKIHEGFIDAFSEYEVPIAMPLENLQEYESARLNGFFGGLFRW